MANPDWSKSLSDVLGHATKETTLISARTGNEYTAEIIPQIKVIATSSVQETNDGKYRYSIVDTSKDLEYSIKTENKIEVKFGTILLFNNVRGGATNNGGWYAAESVEVLQRNA